MKLILGTAEFNPEGYGGQAPPSLTEIHDIFALAREAGISIIDTAESYNCQNLIREQAKGFCIYTKTRDWKVTLDWGDNELRGILYHYQPKEAQINLPFVHRWVNLGVSVYNNAQLPNDEKRIIQIPFNVLDSTFEHCFAYYRTIFVRSIFANGRAFSEYSPAECLEYVKGFNPDGIIIGVRSVKELEETLKAYKQKRRP